MNIGPLEYVVIGVPSERLHDALRAELNSFDNNRGVEIVDLVVATKDADGRLSIKEVRDLDDETRASFGDIAKGLSGLLSTDDVAQLTNDMPAASSAIVVLFEHTWANAMTDAVRDAGGVALGGGMVPHEATMRVVAELEMLEAQGA